MNTPFSVLLYVNEKSNSAWLKRSLDSVLSNTVCPDEIVIAITGNISGEIKSIIAELQKKANIQCFSHPVPYGRGTTLKMFLPKCSHELIALQDVESVSLPNRFEKQLAYFAEHPETAVLGGYAQEMDHNNEALPTAVREVPESEQEIKTFLKNHSPFIYRTIMFKKQAILDAGNYKAFPNLEDEYLWVRVIGKGYKTANLTSVIANIHSIDAYEHMVLALPHFQMKKELFSTMHQMGMIGSFTYYRLVCTAFIKYLILPNWFRRVFHLYDIQA